jgi:flagellar biosynthetic protein FliR
MTPENAIHIIREALMAAFWLSAPLLAMLLIVDISLALLGRLNSQLQLIALAFPIKMMLTLGLLAWLILVFPQVLARAAGPVMGLVRKLLLG